MVGESHALYQLASRECVTGKSELAWPSFHRRPWPPAGRLLAPCHSHGAGRPRPRLAPSFALLQMNMPRAQGAAVTQMAAWESKHLTRAREGKPCFPG